MADIQIRIKNIREIKAAFGKAPRLMTNELNKAIRFSIVKIEDTSRKFTPVDTGVLRGSHSSRFSNLRGEVGTNTNYDIYVHEGTRYMRARPYLRKAVQANQLAVDRYFASAVQNVLTQIGRAT